LYAGVDTLLEGVRGERHEVGHEDHVLAVRAVESVHVLELDDVLACEIERGWADNVDSLDFGEGEGGVDDASGCAEVGVGGGGGGL
jgi:hypothetical protein